MGTAASLGIPSASVASLRALLRAKIWRGFTLRGSKSQISALSFGAQGRQGWPWAGGLGLGVLLLGGAAAAATVVAVDSGDTLRVRAGGLVRTIRLACLDAPELEQTPHGPGAKATLQRLLPIGAPVTLISPARPSATTAVAEVVSSAGNVNLEMVRTGQAFSTLDDQPQCDPLRYAEAENTAQFRRLGVWQVEGGLQRPWDWRIARAEAEAQRAREQLVQQHLAELRAARAARINAAPQPSRGAAGPQLQPFQPGFYQQCLAMSNQQFMAGSMGVSPPKGLLENLCNCLNKPKANETTDGLTKRCTTAFMGRVNSYLKPGL